MIMKREEEGEEKGSPGRQAVEVLKALSHFEYPEDPSSVGSWLDRTKPLQFLVKSLCLRDGSGRLTLECVNVVFDLMASRGEKVNPGIWDVLEIVEEQDIKRLTETFLKDSKARLANILCAMVSGICLCGRRIPKLRAWCFTYLEALEERQKYSVLLSVSQEVVNKLLQAMVLPYSRQIAFSVFERLLYPMTYAHVFNQVLNQIPDVLLALDGDDLLHKFTGLVKTLMDRFPPSPGRKESYEKVQVILDACPETKYRPEYAVWSKIPKKTNKLASLLECPVCYERFVTPVTACENGHCICSNCKYQLKSCPICRAQFSSIRMTIVDQIMEVTEFHCKNSDAGCKVKLPYEEIWDHEADCEYRTVSCDVVIYDASKLVCNEDVIAAYFHEHMEKHHKTFVTRFELGVEWRGELGRKRINEVRLLKNSTGSLYFIERIYVTDEEIFFSYHYVGKREEAGNYIYTININGLGIPQKIRYTNFCLSNYMGVLDTEEDQRCFILDPEKIFDAHQTKFEYSVLIEDVNAYRIKVKKNKFSV